MCNVDSRIYNGSMKYTNQHIQGFFDISHQTVQNWCKSFGDYLSPSARPAKGKVRVFTDEDLMVFGLAKTLLKEGKGYDDVVAALANGERGEIPETSIELMPAPVSGQVLALRESLASANQYIQQLRTNLDEQRGQNILLERQLLDAQIKIDKLNREIGKLEAR